MLIFDNRYQSSSGSLQATLLKITDTAKEIGACSRPICKQQNIIMMSCFIIAIEKRLHSGLVLLMIEKALAINEKGE